MRGELTGELTGVRFSTTFGFMSSVLSIGAKCSSTDEGEEESGGVVEQNDNCCCTLLLSGETRPDSAPSSIARLVGTVQSVQWVPLLNSGLIALSVFINGDVF